jgi:hypothetical protein
VRAVGRVDVDQDRAQLRRPVLHEDPLRAVRRPDADPVALADAEGVQPERGGVDLGDQFRVAEPSAGGALDQRLVVAHPRCRPIQVRPDRVAQQGHGGRSTRVREEGGDLRDLAWVGHCILRLIEWHGNLARGAGRARARQPGTSAARSVSPWCRVTPRATCCWSSLAAAEPCARCRGIRRPQHPGGATYGTTMLPGVGRDYPRLAVAVRSALLPANHSRVRSDQPVRGSDGGLRTGAAHCPATRARSGTAGRGKRSQPIHPCDRPAGLSGLGHLTTGDSGHIVNENSGSRTRLSGPRRCSEREATEALRQECRP